MAQRSPHGWVYGVPEKQCALTDGNALGYKQDVSAMLLERRTGSSVGPQMWQLPTATSKMVVFITRPEAA
ncbi:hypothetical protein GCM10022421_28290 [Oceanisphaera sediminis]|uniref:Uncharacterized protein n=1 Tax=Oceanisphaera sediminis TaxID=981381 RepID=A0ABP7EKW3_9GAMM